VVWAISIFTIKKKEKGMTKAELIEKIDCPPATCINNLQDESIET